MIVLGIDPGTTRVGYGIIKKSPAPRLIDCGLLAIKSIDHNVRIQEAGRHLKKIIKKYSPDMLSIEKLFFVNNQKTGLQVAEMRGALIFIALNNNIPVREYAPTEVKKAVTGSGHADKRAVEKMVKLHILMPEYKLVDDVYDALAIGLIAIYDIKNR